MLSSLDTIAAAGQAHVGQAKSERDREAEIERVAVIIQKMVDKELTLEQAYLEIEGPGNVCLETFRKVVRSGTDCDDYIDVLKTNGFNGESIRKEIDASRKSLLKIENFKKEIAKEEANIQLCVENAFNFRGMTMPKP